MPRRCAVCNSLDSPRARAVGLTFHAFPANDERCRKWELAVEKSGESGFRTGLVSYLCSAHFRDDDFQFATKNRKLRTDAVPSIFGVDCLALKPPRTTQPRAIYRVVVHKDVISVGRASSPPLMIRRSLEPRSHVPIRTRPPKPARVWNPGLQAFVKEEFVVDNEPSRNDVSVKEEADDDGDAGCADVSRSGFTSVKVKFFTDEEEYGDEVSVKEEADDDGDVGCGDVGSSGFTPTKEKLFNAEEEYEDEIPMKQAAFHAEEDYEDEVNESYVKEEVYDEENECGVEALRKDVGMDIDEDAGCSYDSLFMTNGAALSSDEGTSSLHEDNLCLSASSSIRPPKRKRTELTVSAKLDLIDRYRQLNVKSRRQAASLLNVSHGFLNQVLKKEADLRGGVPTKIRNRCGKDKEIEDGLLRWLREASAAGGPPLSGAALCQKAEEIAARLGKADFKATDGWLNRWKKRNSLLMPRKKRPDGEAGERLDDVISGYPPSCVFCASEVPLCFRLLPGEFPEEPARHRVTVLMCCSLTGEREPLVVIGRDGAPRCFKDVRAFPVTYRASRHALITRDIWNEWLQCWNLRLRSEMRRVLLIVADSAAHVSVARLSHITVRHLEQNFSPAALLPTELGVSKALKGFFRRSLHQRMMDLSEDCNDALSAADVLKKVTLLDALCLLATAWRRISPATIIQCWHDAGFQAACADPEGVNDPKPPPGISSEEFHVWVAQDDHMTVAAEDDEATSADGTQIIGAAKKEEEEEEEEVPDIPTPSKSVMRVALQLLRIGLERRGFEALETFCLLEEDIRDCLRRDPSA